MSLRMTKRYSFDTFLFWGSLLLPFFVIGLSYFMNEDPFQNIMVSICIMFIGLMLWVFRLWE